MRNGGRWGTAALCAGDLSKYCGDKGTLHTVDRRNYRTTFWRRACMCTNHQVFRPSFCPDLFVCLCTWLCTTTTQKWLRYKQLIQLKLSTFILADWFLTWDWSLSCARSGNYKAYFHPYFWNLITNILTLSMPCMTDMSHLQILHQLMSSAVVWPTACSCHGSDGHIFSHTCSEAMSWWMACNSIWPYGPILLCACHLLCHISNLGMYLIQ